MNKIIPFTKDIKFKTKIGEIASISLEHDVKISDLDILGNFYIEGSYKMLEASELKEDYSYKIPIEVAISNEYDTTFASIDVDDFYYEIINEEILRVHINLKLEDLEAKVNEEELLDVRCEKKEEQIDKKGKIEEEKEEEQEEKKEKEERKFESLEEIFNKKEDIDEIYTTYSIYLMQDEDTMESILEKYQITKEELLNYNSIDSIKSGNKLIIPA